MSVPSILLTGATGTLGASVLDQLLSNGHKVTAVIRSFKRSYAFLSQTYAPHIQSGTLVLLEIPDLAAPNVFDEPAKNVDAIIHVATPITSSDFEATMIHPTWTIDHSILTAATNSPTVKRVIVTGSIVSTMIFPDDFFQAKVISEKNWNSLTLEQALETQMGAYSYAKTSAEQKAWAFMEREKPKFDLVFLLVPGITGKSIQGGWVPSKDFMGGIGAIYKALFDVETPGFTIPYFMDSEDAAAIHLKSLSPDVPGNERYLCHAPGLLSANLLATKVRETFPELRDRVPAPAPGAGDGFPSPMMKFDISKFEKVFGSQWRGWWESARGSVEDIIRFEPESARAN